jgi:hypothetical protein
MEMIIFPLRIESITLKRMTKNHPLQQKITFWPFTMPGPVRPALPFLCSALARLIQYSCNRIIRVDASYPISFTLPEYEKSS